MKLFLAQRAPRAAMREEKSSLIDSQMRTQVSKVQTASRSEKHSTERKRYLNEYIYEFRRIHGSTRQKNAGKNGKRFQGVFQHGKEK
jgi:hypothetical protein